MLKFSAAVILKFCLSLVDVVQPLCRQNCQHSFIKCLHLIVPQSRNFVLARTDSVHVKFMPRNKSSGCPEFHLCSSVFPFEYSRTSGGSANDTRRLDLALVHIISHNSLMAISFLPSIPSPTPPLYNAKGLQ